MQVERARKIQTYWYPEDPEPEYLWKRDGIGRRRRRKWSGSLSFSVSSLRRWASFLFFLAFYKSVKDDRIKWKMQRRKKKETLLFLWIFSLLLSYNQSCLLYLSISLYLSLSFTPSSLRTQRVQKKEGLFVDSVPVWSFFFSVGRRAVTWRLRHTLGASGVNRCGGAFVLGSIDFPSFAFFFLHINNFCVF